MTNAVAASALRRQSGPQLRHALVAFIGASTSVQKQQKHRSNTKQGTLVNFQIVLQQT
jgi:hypothetical protein